MEAMTIGTVYIALSLICKLIETIVWLFVMISAILITIIIGLHLHDRIESKKAKRKREEEQTDGK